MCSRQNVLGRSVLTKRLRWSWQNVHPDEMSADQWFVSEPDRGGGAQNSTDWSPPSPPTTSKPATLASFWISGEFVIVTLCYKLSVDWTPVSDLVVERVKKMHKRRTEEIFFPYSILAFWDALYNCQITDFEGSASTCIYCIAALLSLKDTRNCQGQ